MVTQITFEHPGMLWFLFSVPLLVFTHLYFMHHAKRQAIRFGNFETIQRITGKRLLTRNATMLLLRILTLICLVLGAAGTTVWRETRTAGNDVVILLDASASMAASDMGGTRIEAAKKSAIDFAEQIDRQAAIGVVQFSGLAEVLTAPTTERDEVLAALNAVELKTVGGTDLAGAITVASSLLSASERGKSIVLLTDGVASVSLYDSNPIPRAIEYAQKQGVVIHTIGVGTKEAGIGQYIPGLQAQVQTFDEQNLQAIANATGGTYSWASNQAQLTQAYEQALAEGNTGVKPLQVAFGFIFAALIILFIEWGLANTRFRILP